MRKKLQRKRPQTKRLQTKMAAVTVIAALGLTGCQALGMPGGSDADSTTAPQVQETVDQPSEGVQTGEGTSAEISTEWLEETEAVDVTMDDATLKAAIANSPEWAKEVWEQFNEYGETASFWIQDTYAGFMDRLVFDNGYGQKYTNFPAMDYDGDGTVDRIYGNHGTGEDGVYLFSGSGEILLLGKPYWGVSGATWSADLTGDGVNELVYLSWVSGSGGETYCAAAWERLDGQWNKMDITPSTVSGTDSVGYLHTLTLPLQVEKTGESSIRLIQPDVGKSIDHEISEFGSMSDLWLWEDSKPHMTEIYSSCITVVGDPDTGKSNLLVTGGYGNKWYAVPVFWLLGYEEGQWKVLDVSGEQMYQYQYALSAEEIEGVEEFLRIGQTNVRVSQLNNGADPASLEVPGSHDYRVYLDLRENGTYTSYDGPAYYVWSDTYPTESGTQCVWIDKNAMGWWHGAGDVIYLEDYEEDDFLLLCEGEYVIEDTNERIGYDFPEKEELLKTYWQLTLENVFNEHHEGESQYQISACINDFTKHTRDSGSVNLFYDREYWQIGGSYQWQLDGGIRWMWIKPETLKFTEEIYQEKAAESVLVMDGTVKKSWTATFEEALATTVLADEIDVLEGYVSGTMLGTMGQLYRQQTGRLEGTMQAELYLMADGFDPDMDSLSFWVCFKYQEPVKVVVEYTETVTEFEMSYTFMIDGEADFAAEREKDTYYKMEVDITTSR